MSFVLVLVAALAGVQVPEGAYVLPNGILAEGEWNDAVRVPLDSDTDLLAKRDARSLFLAIAFKGPRHTGVDLFLSCQDCVRRLHVSSALGEASLRGGTSAELSWALPAWWVANTVGTVHADGQLHVVEPEAFEFQISRSELGACTSVFIRLKRPPKDLPKGAEEGAESGWARLNLD